MIGQRFHRRAHLVGLAVSIAGLILVQPSFAADQSHNVTLPHGPTQATISVCFVPAQVCVDPIVDAITKATSSIRVQAYGFTSAPILSALVAAKGRGVDVAVILDKSNDRTSRNGATGGDDDAGRQPRGNRYTGATYMDNAGVPVFIDYRPAIAHNKIIVIDGHLVIGGSYNYTASAEHRNAENVTFVDSPEVTGWYLDNWLSRKEVSRAFKGSRE